jgi:hypothetical protein
MTKSGRNSVRSVFASRIPWLVGALILFPISDWLLRALLPNPSRADAIAGGVVALIIVGGVAWKARTWDR